MREEFRLVTRTGYPLLALPLLGLLACEGESSGGGASSKLQPLVVPPTGIAACDTYLARYETCIQTAFPQAQRGQALDGLDRSRDQWVKLADDAFKRDSLTRMCENALVAAEVELSTYNCQWGTVGSGGAGSGGAGSGGAASGGVSSGGASSGGASASGGSSSGGTPGSGGSSGSSCTPQNATELGAPGTLHTIARNACVKVQAGYPTWWGTRNMSLQVQSPGTYPAPFTWSNACNGTSGTNSFTADWQSKVFGPVSASCATVISFTGGSSGTIKVVYYGQ